jgi:hypothetical protein
MWLPRLYHWSPSDRRIEILREGLKPFSHATMQSGDLKWPYISLSLSPSCAWGYSGGLEVEWLDEIEQWDLWQVDLPENAEVHVRPFFGRQVEEVKVHTAIPADCIWYVGTRDRTLPAEEMKSG